MLFLFLLVLLAKRSDSFSAVRFSNAKSEVILVGDNYDAAYAATMEPWQSRRAGELAGWGSRHRGTLLV